MLTCIALCIITLTISCTAAVIRNSFQGKKGKMCSATFKRKKDRTDEQPLQSDVDLYSTYWNGDSVISEFSYFEPLQSNEVVEMKNLDGRTVYV